MASSLFKKAAAAADAPADMPEPTHGGVYERQADGSLKVLEGGPPKPDAAADAPAAATPAAPDLPAAAAQTAGEGA